MFQRKRLAIELIIAGVLVIVALGAIWIITGWHFTTRRKHAASVRRLADEIRIHVIQARRREKDFLLEDLRSAVFYENEENSKNLRLHTESMESLEESLNSLSRLVNEDELVAVSHSFNEYRQLFSTIVPAYKTRGYKDWGLVGQWRDAAHSVEQHAQASHALDLRIALLELRRHEKDFLLRGIEYEHAVYEGIRTLQSTIGDDLRLTELASEYERAFSAYVAIERRIGLSETEGLQADIRDAAFAVESTAGELAARATDAESDVQRKQVRYSIAILFLGTIAGAVTFYRIAQSIVRPLSELRQAAISLSHHDMTVRFDTNAKNEVGDLAVTFNRLLDRLNKAFEHERRFSDNAAHQLRTPLTIIQGEIDVTLRQTRSLPDYKDCLSTISRVTQEMIQVVESLLFLSRASSESPPRDVQTLELSAWITDYIRRFERHERTGDLSSSVEGKPSIVTSPLLLTQLLDNLIGNALRYSENGSPVLIEASVRGDDVEISVHDEGIGVPQTERESIFEPFYRSSVTRNVGSIGTGLGLSIARSIADSINGRIEFRNAKNGSTFVVVLQNQQQ